MEDIKSKLFIFNNKQKFRSSNSPKMGWSASHYPNLGYSVAYMVLTVGYKTFFSTNPTLILETFTSIYANNSLLFLEVVYLYLLWTTRKLNSFLPFDLYFLTLRRQPACWILRKFKNSGTEIIMVLWSISILSWLDHCSRLCSWRFPSQRRSSHCNNSTNKRDWKR